MSVAIGAGCSGGGAAGAGESRQVGSFAGNQGAAWEAVFLPYDEPVDVQVAFEDGRRDHALGIHRPRNVIEARMWPEAPHPTLADTRRLFLPRRATEVLYIRERRAPGRGWW